MLTGIAFVVLFVRMPHWVGYGALAELPYGVLLVVFATVGARSGVWIYDRTIGRPEREHVAAHIKAAEERQNRIREAELAEITKVCQQAAKFEELKTRCENYETEIRVLRAELARRASAFATSNS